MKKKRKTVADRLQKLFNDAGGKTVPTAKIQKILVDEYGLDAEEYGSDFGRNLEIANRRFERHIEKLNRKRGR
ncbi:MAG: hypothetical protein ACAH83_08230 [Alphaproteobacteria bacterium]